MKVPFANESGDGTPKKTGRAPTEREKRMADYPIEKSRIDPNLLVYGRILRSVYEAAMDDPDACSTHETVFDIDEFRDEDADGDNEAEYFGYYIGTTEVSGSALALGDRKTNELMFSERVIPSQLVRTSPLKGLDNRIRAKQVLSEWRDALHPLFEPLVAVFVGAATLGEIGLGFRGIESDKSKIGGAIVEAGLERLRYVIGKGNSLDGCKKEQADVTPAAAANDNFDAFRRAA